MFTFKKLNIISTDIINILIAIIPLSLIIGNLATNINLLLIIFFGLVKYKTKIFFFNEKLISILVYFLFFFLILTTLLNNLNFLENSEIHRTHFVKSILFLKYLFIFLILNKSIEIGDFNLKPLYISIAFFSFAVAVDLIIQSSLGRNIFNFQIIQDRPSSFFGEELIAGGYLQKFIFFFIFLFLTFSKLKLIKALNKNYIIFISFIIFFIPIFLSGSRMSTILYFISTILFFIINKQIKNIFLFFTVIAILFKVIFSFYGNQQILKNKYMDLTRDSIEILKVFPKLILLDPSNKDFEFKSSPTGYLIHFNSGLQVWKQNKLFGGGLKSFRINCVKDNNQTCNTHPHNYLLEILVDTGLLGLSIVYLIFFLGLKKFINFYFYKNRDLETKLLSYPIFQIIFFEFFPFRSSGSFFTTNNATIIIFFLVLFLNIEKLNFKKLKK